MDSEVGKRVVVVGAGIVGASLVYHLAGKCADITLVEAEDIASGVTGSSFAWINRSHDKPDPIAQLRGAAIEEYRRLESELPALEVRWTGALTYSKDPSEEQETLGNRSSGSLVLRPRILELEPNLKHPPQHALYDSEEGAVDAVQATCALIAAAQARGVKVLTQTRVVGFSTECASVTGVETTVGTIDADVVVLAAGTGITALTEMLQVSLPIDASPAIFLRYRLQPGLVRTIISNSEMEVRQDAEGALLAAEDYLGESLQNQPAEVGLRTAEAIRNELEGVTSIEPELACVGLRPIPVDGVPIIGYLPNIGGLYVCAMHPGVTLAAIVGRLASEEIAYGNMSSALCACRPQRFFPA